MAKSDIRRYSADELKAMKSRGDYVPTRKDAPEPEIDENFWEKARVVTTPQRKVHTGIRLDADVLDESPAAYKDISAVMAAQDDLIEIVHRLRQIVNVKG